MSRATHTPEADARLEARGREIGTSIKGTATQVRSTARRMTAAVMSGTAEPVPALRPSGGGSSISAQVETPSAGGQAPTNPVQTQPGAGTTAPTQTQPVVETTAPTSTPTKVPQQVETAPTSTTSTSAATTQSTAEGLAAGQAQTASQQPTHPSTEGAFRQLGQELGTQPGRPPSTASRREQIESAVQDAQAAGWVDQQGNPTGVHAVVQEHGEASGVRAATGQTGQTRQSAHVGVTSLLRTLQGYSRRLALTVLMPPAQHRAFDQHWMRWISNRRRAIRAFGSTDFRAPLTDVLDAQRQAIRQTPGPPINNAARWSCSCSARSRRLPPRPAEWHGHSRALACGPGS